MWQCGSDSVHEMMDSPDLSRDLDLLSPRRYGSPGGKLDGAIITLQDMSEIRNLAGAMAVAWSWVVILIKGKICGKYAKVYMVGIITLVLFNSIYRKKFRSQTSDNVDKWKSRDGKSQRGEAKK